MPQSSSKTHDVTILGQTFHVKSDLDAEGVRLVENHVSEIFARIKKARPDLAINQIALLASLNLCEELFLTREKTAAKIEAWVERLVSLLPQDS